MEETVMKKKLLMILLSIVMIVGLLPITAFANEETVLTIDGTEYTASQLYSGDKIYGSGWIWDTQAGGLILNGYSGGFIESDDDLEIILADGSDNRITVTNYNYNHEGLCVYGDCSISGNGNLSIQMDNSFHTGLYVKGEFSISGSGDLNINASKAGIDTLKAISVSGGRNINITSYSNGISSYTGGIDLSGSGYITISSEGYGIYSSSSVDDVVLGGSGSVIIDARSSGIYSYADIVYSGSGSVDIESDSENALYLINKGNCFRLNGTGAPLSFKAGEGNKAIFNYNDNSSPAYGTNYSDYTVTGSPSSRSVIFDKTALTIDNEDFSGTDLRSDINRKSSKGWSWNAAGKELTLNGYHGGYIESSFNLNIVLAEGTDNMVTVPDNYLEGISSNGSITLNGRGDLTVKGAKSITSGISCRHDLTFNTKGNIDVSAGAAAINTLDSINITGSGSINVNAGNVSVRAYGGDVNISGSTDLTINATYEGINAPEGSINITGSGNISITSNDEGMIANEPLNISGSRNITINSKSYGIYTDDEMTISNNGNIDIHSHYTGIYVPDGSIKISGSGNINIESDATGMYSDDAVNIGGSKNININAGDYGIIAGWEFIDSGSGDLSIISVSNALLCFSNDIVFSGSGRVSAASTDSNAVSLDDIGYKVLLNGTGAPIIFSSKSGKAAVYNEYDGTSPVAGDNFYNYYDNVTGQPNSSYVKYDTTFKLPFTDVKKSDWFYNDVVFAVINGLMNGTSSTTFEPNSKTTRAMIVTILYRSAGCPPVSGGNSFKDVPDGMWYTDPITWANKNGVVEGYSSDLFGTNDYITREQIATIMYRYAKKIGYDMSRTRSIDSFIDAGTVSNYAIDAMKWAYGSGLINGTSEITLSPKDGATRAQIAAILHRFFIF